MDTVKLEKYLEHIETWIKYTTWKHSQYFFVHFDLLQLQPLLCLADAGVVIFTSSCKGQIKISPNFWIPAGWLNNSNIWRSYTILFGGTSAAHGTILGANACGLRDSICCFVSTTLSWNSTLLPQPSQAQPSPQKIPAPKQSQ